MLIRALEPVEGIERMHARRPDAQPRDLARGPRRLALALGIDLDFDGADLCTGRGLWLGAIAESPCGVRCAVTTRIGIARETHRLLRFYEPGSPFASGPRKLLSATRFIKLFGKLFAAEARSKTWSADRRQRLRQRYSAHVLEVIRVLMIEQSPGVLPQSLLGRALSYLRVQWPKLVRYLENGD